MYKGQQYPIKKTSHGFMANSEDIDQIKADLLQLLLTEPGERVMLAEFGTPLKRLLYEPNDTALAFDAERIIVESINRWEPRIELIKVHVTSSINEDKLHPDDTKNEKDAILGVTIEFVDPGNLVEKELLQLEIPLGG